MRPCKQQLVQVLSPHDPEIVVNFMTANKQIVVHAVQSESEYGMRLPSTFYCAPWRISTAYRGLTLASATSDQLHLRSVGRRLIGQ